MAKTKPCCKECVYCNMHGRAAGWQGRGDFYCENPNAKKLPPKAFGNSAPLFICYGTSESNTKPTIKTKPRWCPLVKKEN